MSFNHEPDLATGVSTAQQPSSPPLLQGQVASRPCRCVGVELSVAIPQDWATTGTTGTGIGSGCDLPWLHDGARLLGPRIQSTRFRLLLSAGRLALLGQRCGQPSTLLDLHRRCCICCERVLSRQTVVMRTRRSRPTATARSTSSGRSSTCSCPRGGPRPRPAGSSKAPSPRCGSRRSRWLPTTRRWTRRCSRSWCRRPGIAPIGRPTPDRGRPWPSQVEAGSDAWAQGDRNARIVIAGHGLVQHLRRGHYELAVEEPVARRVAVAFGELALAI